MPYFVYILTNSAHSVFYTGVTGDLLYRAQQHRSKAVPGFTQRYNVTRLVYYEEFDSAYEAITREKQLKAGSRKKKMQLIDNFKPKWLDLYEQLSGEDEGALKQP